MKAISTAPAHSELLSLLVYSSLLPTVIDVTFMTCLLCVVRGEQDVWTLLFSGKIQGLNLHQLLSVTPVRMESKD